jgi:hypothetical protein
MVYADINIVATGVGGYYLVGDAMVAPVEEDYKPTIGGDLVTTNLIPLVTGNNRYYDDSTKSSSNSFSGALGNPTAIIGGGGGGIGRKKKRFIASIFEN